MTLAIAVSEGAGGSGVATKASLWREKVFQSRDLRGKLALLLRLEYHGKLQHSLKPDPFVPFFIHSALLVDLLGVIP